MAKNKKDESPQVDFFSKGHGSKDGTERQLPPDIETFRKAAQVRHLESGEIYGLVIYPAEEVQHRQTHVCKNAHSFWQGTEAQFRETFDKV